MASREHISKVATPPRLSYTLPLTYGADVLHGAVHGGHMMPFALDLAVLAGFCVFLFAASLWNIQRRWIV